MTSADDQKEFFSDDRFLTMTTVFNLVIVCLTLLGNGTVIIVMVARRRQFSSFTNRLILHQSIIDALAGLVFFLHRIVKSPNLKVSEKKQFPRPSGVPLLWPRLAALVGVRDIHVQPRVYLTGTIPGDLLPSQAP